MIFIFTNTVLIFKKLTTNEYKQKMQATQIQNPLPFLQSICNTGGLF